MTLRCLGTGPTLSVDELPRRPYVINLWASWCLPCQREAPRLADAAAAARGQVDFLGINTQDDRNSALDFLHYVGIRYAQLFDPNGDVLHRLGIPGVPVTLAVDSAGRVVYRRVGEISKSELSAAVRAAKSNAAGEPGMAR